MVIVDGKSLVGSCNDMVAHLAVIFQRQRQTKCMTVCFRYITVVQMM